MSFASLKRWPTSRVHDEKTALDIVADNDGAGSRSLHMSHFVDKAAVTATFDQGDPGKVAAGPIDRATGCALLIRI